LGIVKQRHGRPPSPALKESAAQPLADAALRPGSAPPVAPSLPGTLRISPETFVVSSGVTSRSGWTRTNDPTMSRWTGHRAATIYAKFLLLQRGLCCDFIQIAW
jgi:hypothetical protein